MTLQQMLANELKKKVGVERLVGLVGIKSLAKGAEYEDQTVRASAKAEHEALWGGDLDLKSKIEDDQMMVGGDFNYTPTPAPAPTPEQNGFSWAKVLTLAAALVAAGWLFSGEELPDFIRGLEFPGQENGQVVEPEGGDL